ncbi:Long-chain-fatty-acid-CoA ligase [Candidatus Burkholderia verschuerenii]|uniref:Long-chain-fatty-acid--CoA ligase n=1 Tax=Candidatus Burkholderia verschuerenii TaxID=242163 RepID=A0A0L0M4T8_9BURK|nr:AMP-binding protein [Candidatus Burkholderia verschuerenii]KND57306.1 Long-chain-fatty-acid-CoA ligase [Candidatus Burkholderia verschuerenii]
MKPAQASLWASAQMQGMHGTDGIWYASYAPGVAHEIDPARYRSLVHFFDESVQRYRAQTAFTSLGADLSFDALDRKAHAFASYLQEIGVQHGDRVALMMPNTLAYPVAMFGALIAGAIVVNMNPLYTVRELAHQLKDCGAQTIVVFDLFGKTLQDALPGSRVKQVIVTSLGDLLADGLNVKGRALDLYMRHVRKQVPDFALPEAVSLRQAIARGAKRKLEPVRVGHGDIAFIQYTGGTTGVPKGAMLTHRNIIANVLQALEWSRARLIDGEEIVVTPLPLYHIYSLTMNALVFLGIGARNVLIVNPRDIDALLRTLRDVPFTAISALNTLYAALLDKDEFRQRDFSSLKLAMAGGMATQRAIAERFEAVTGTAILEGYGLSECSPLVCASTLHAARDESFEGSIGLPVPSTLVRLRRDDGAWADIGEPGELCVQGPQVMKGYWNRPAETALAIDAQGWFATGDIGTMDARGFIRIVDRKKNMMIVSGFNVYPTEIEDVLSAHPKVRAVAAVGVPDPVTGERVKAYVVPRDATLSVEELLAFARLHLTGYKVPAFVEFRDSLPLTSIGKVMRRGLRAPDDKETKP